MKTSQIMRALEVRDLLELAKEIAARHRVTMDELLGRSRRRPEALARQELWWRAYEVVPSLNRLGEIFDRDHSSILAALRKQAARERGRQACSFSQRSISLGNVGLHNCDPAGAATSCVRPALVADAQQQTSGQGVFAIRISEPSSVNP